MDKIPFAERVVINGLVDLWSKNYEAQELNIHIDKLSSTWGSGAGVQFFRQVYANLRAKRRDKYSYSTPDEFRHFLESEYIQQAQEHAEQVERQNREKAEAKRREQEKAKAKRKEEEKARAKREEEEEKARLKQKAEKEARWEQYIKPINNFGFKERYCWHCKNEITGLTFDKCPNCHGYKCIYCKKCLCDYPGKKYKTFNNSNWFDL